MHNKTSDYALNKLSRDSIVYKSVTGEHIHIRHEDFPNSKEFERWKAWSDEDYHATEKHDRRQKDFCLAFDESMDGCAPSAEEALFAAEKQNADELCEQIRNCLTETQYRRIMLYCFHKLTEAEIARIDNVGQRRISTSLTLGKKKLKKHFLSARKKEG